MTESEAIQLIQAGIPKESQAKSWVDLGSGNGTFTKALAQLLADGSTILAVDQEYHTIKSPNDQVTVNFLQADFTKADLPNSLDGILIANALHYVKDQLQFLTSIKNQLKSNGRLIIIEYDSAKSNAWVPYPVTFQKLKDLLVQSGFSHVQKIGERNSIYNTSKMYACVADSTESRTIHKS